LQKQVPLMLLYRTLMLSFPMMLEVACSL